MCFNNFNQFIKIINLWIRNLTFVICFQFRLNIFIVIEMITFIKKNVEISTQILTTIKFTCIIEIFFKNCFETMFFMLKCDKNVINEIVFWNKNNLWKLIILKFCIWIKFCLHLMLFILHFLFFRQSFSRILITSI